MHLNTLSSYGIFLMLQDHFVLLTEIDSVNWPPIRNSKAVVSNVSPSSECSDEEHLPKRHL